MKTQTLIGLVTTSSARIFIVVTLLVLVLSSKANALPRPPMWPPLPELVPVLHYESFDDGYHAGVSNAVVKLPGYGMLRESWSGYSFERTGVVVPCVISGLSEMGEVQVATEQGALRFWFRPDWASGSGPGKAVTLAELVAMAGAQSAVLWSLQVSADGAVVQLVGPEGEEVLLAADIAWASGTWHQVILNYGIHGTELLLDGEKVAQGPATLAVPASVARLVIGSSLAGELSAGGEIDEVFCFARPLRLALHYLPFRDLAVLGPISESELAYRLELMAKWKALKAEKATEAEESGGGMQMLRLSGPAANCVTNGPVYLTNVVAGFTTNDGWQITFDIAGGTNEVVYDIFSTTEFIGNDITNSVWTWLETGMTCETHYFTNQPTNQVFYILTVPGADRDGDGIYDGWEWKHFGTLMEPPNGDYDGDGVSNGVEYTNNTDPNTIQFSLGFGTTHFNGNSATGSVLVLQGVPESMAVLVNSTNFESAVWQPFSSNVVASLGATDGVFLVWVGLRGHAWDTERIWHGIEITRDTVPPLITITNPVSTVVSRSRIQLQGYVSESLASLVFRLTNTAGLTTNQTGFITGMHPDTNTWKFTTNYFQCYDVTLTNGVNTVTLKATDLAGNVATTNLSLTLDTTSNTNPPAITILWPPNNSVIAGTNFTLRGQVDDDTAAVTVSWLGTNGEVALVERGGGFSIPNLPLSGVTNIVTLAATNSLGYGSVLQRTVIKSTTTVTLNPLSSDQSAASFVTVTGTVSATNLDVWINGIQATVNGDGSWQAVNVPLAAKAGSAAFDIKLYPVGSDPNTTPPNAIESPTVTLPPRVSAAGYIERYFVSWDGQLSVRERNWQPGVGGRSRNYKGPGFSEIEFLTDWPGEWPDGQTLSGQRTDVGPYPEIPLLPLQHWEEAGAKPHVTARRTVRTPLLLTAGGPASKDAEQLIRLTVSAATYSQDVTYYVTPDLLEPISSFAWQYAGDVPLPVSAIRVFDQTPTPTATNAGVGEVFVTQPAGAVRELPVTVVGTNKYSVVAKAEEVKFTIVANGVTLEPDTVVSNAEFCVGQKITFTTNWSQLPAGAQSRQVQWAFEGNFVNDSNQISSQASVNYTTNTAKLTNETTTAWWVSGGYSPPATYTARLTETLTLSNGNSLTVSGKGLFHIHRPRVGLYVPANPKASLFYKDVPVLRLGADPPGGFAFRVLSAFDGQLRVTQLVEGYATNSQIAQQSQGMELDNQEFYAGLNKNILAGSDPDFANVFSFNDGASILCSSNTAIHKDFHDYVRFKPGTNQIDGSIFVTLGTNHWHVYAATELVQGSQGLDYSPLPPPPPANPVPRDASPGEALVGTNVFYSETFPQWTNTTTNQ